MVFFYGYFGSGGRSIGMTNNVSHETLWSSMTITAGERGEAFPLMMTGGMRSMVIVTAQGFFKLGVDEMASHLLES